MREQVQLNLTASSLVREQGQLIPAARAHPICQFLEEPTRSPTPEHTQLSPEVLSGREQVQLILAQKWDEFMKDFEEPPSAPASRQSPQRPPLPPRAPKSPVRMQVDTVQSLPPLVLDLGEFAELSQRQKEGTGESEVLVKPEHDGMESNLRAEAVVEGGEEKSTETLEGPEGECIKDSVAGAAEGATERVVIRLGGETGFGTEEQAVAKPVGGSVSAHREEARLNTFMEPAASSNSERLSLAFDAPIAADGKPAEAETDDAPQKGLSEAPSSKAAGSTGDDVMAALAPPALEGLKPSTSKSSSQGKSGFLSTARAWWKGAKTAAPKSEGADGDGTEGLVGRSGVDPEVRREVAESQRLAMALAVEESAEVAGAKVDGNQGSAEMSETDQAVIGGVSITQLLSDVKSPVEDEGTADVAVVNELSTGTFDRSRGGEESEGVLAYDSPGEASPQKITGEKSAASWGTEIAAPLTPQTLAAEIAKAEAECRVLQEKMASAAFADVSQVGRVEGAGSVSEDAPEVVTVKSELVEEEGVVQDEELERDVEVDQLHETAPAMVGLLGSTEGVSVQTESLVDNAEGQGLQGGSAGFSEEKAPRTPEVMKPPELTGAECFPGVGSAVAEASVELTESPPETVTRELVTEVTTLRKSGGGVPIEGLEEADCVVEGPKEAERVLEEVCDLTAEEITTEQESEYALAVIGSVEMPVEAGVVLGVAETADKPAAETRLLETEVESPLADVFDSTVEPPEEAEKANAPVETLQAQDAPAVEVETVVQAVSSPENAEEVADLGRGQMLAQEPLTGGVALVEGSPPAKQVEGAGAAVAAPGKAEEVSVKSTASEPAWKIFPGWEGGPVQVQALQTVAVLENSEGVREDGRMGSEPAEEVDPIENPERDVPSVEEVKGDDNPEKSEGVLNLREVERPASSDEKLLALLDNGSDDGVADVSMLTSLSLLGAFEGSEEVEGGKAGFEQGAEVPVVGLEGEDGAVSEKGKEGLDEEMFSRETVLGHQMLSETAIEKPGEGGLVSETNGEKGSEERTIGEETILADPVQKQTAIETSCEEGTAAPETESEIVTASHEGGSGLNRGLNRSLETVNPSESRKDLVGMDEEEAEWGTTISDVRSNAQNERRPSLEPLDANRAPFPATERLVAPAGGRPLRPEDGFRDENGFEGGVKRQVGSPPEKGPGLRTTSNELFLGQKEADVASIEMELDVENAAPKEETRLPPPVLPLQNQAPPLAARPPSRRASRLTIETPKPASLSVTGAETAATWAPRFRGLGDAAVASPRTAALQFASLQEEVAELRAHKERAEAEKGAIEKRWKAARKVGTFASISIA
jgi:hypothetical protein